MKCPYCGHLKSKVLDSRSADGGSKTRRRHECLNCSKRFTTYECIEEPKRLIVVKKNKQAEAFDREKLLQSMLRACKKSEIDIKVLEQAVTEIESQLIASSRREVTSSEIGELALEKLKDINEVAYVRFASVYREFQDIETFMRELEKLTGNDPAK